MSCKNHDQSRKDSKKKYTKPKLKRHGTIPQVVHAQTYY